MLRILSLLAGAAAIMVSTQNISADELAKADVPPMAAVPASSASPGGRDDPVQALYQVCALYPKPGTCESVYRKAMKDESIAAQAVRAEYAGYARYLDGAGSLTESDRQYLGKNAISIPPGLGTTDRAGLHNVIHDGKLSPDARREAVNNFLSRAVAAELYCGFNNCAGEENEASAAGSRPAV